MKQDQVAAILYTVRDFCKTGPDLDASLKKLRAIGYRAVQVSGVGPIPAPEIRRILDDNGMTCCATHEPSDGLRQEPQKFVERLAALGCSLTAYPYPSNVDFEDGASVAALIRDLERAGRVFHEAGMTLCYHNHAHEFYRSGDRPLLARIYDETDPRYLQAELDTHWVQAGGGDPAAWCRRLAGRLPCLHMKDYRVNAKGERDYAEIGYGNLDWPGILAAAESSGCRWYIVEQDTTPGDPFDSLKLSFDYIKANLCR